MDTLLQCSWTRPNLYLSSFFILDIPILINRFEININNECTYSPHIILVTVRILKICEFHIIEVFYK